MLPVHSNSNNNNNCLDRLYLVNQRSRKCSPRDKHLSTRLCLPKIPQLDHNLLQIDKVVVMTTSLCRLRVPKLHLRVKLRILSSHPQFSLLHPRLLLNQLLPMPDLRQSLINLKRQSNKSLLIYPSLQALLPYRPDLKIELAHLELKHRR